MLVFSRGYVRKTPEFTFGNAKLEIVRDYQYLGLIFNYNGKFNKAKQKLYEKGSRAMFSLLRKARCLFSPLDVLLKLFNHIVVPIISLHVVAKYEEVRTLILARNYNYDF